MDDRTQQHIQLLLEAGQKNARDHAKRSIAQHTAEIALKQALGSNRRWIAHADILAAHAAKFIEDTGAAVREICAEQLAFQLFERAACELFDWLGDNFAKAYHLDRPWRASNGSKDVLPDFWQDARAKLELQLRLQAFSFAAAPPVGDEENEGRIQQYSEPVSPTSSISLEEWARKAAEKNVPIRDARKDALSVLGKEAAPTEECREALRV